MKKSAIFTPTHRTATMLRRPGGVSAGEAISRAAQRLEATRDSCVAALDTKIAALAAEGANTSHAALYALATEIYSLAGTFGLKELAQAAESLCELLSSAANKNLADPRLAQSIRVHIDALRTLRRPELTGNAAARAAIVDGLRRVTSKAAPGEGGSTPGSGPGSGPSA